MTFTERLTELLKSKGMSQREFAKAIKTTEVTVSRYISGDRAPKEPVIIKMAEVLGCTTDYLLGLEDTNRAGKYIYCDADRDDWKTDDIPINMGDFGEYEINLFVSAMRKCFCVDFGEVHREPLISVHTEISYCPYCGRKLKGGLED